MKWNKIKSNKNIQENQESSYRQIMNTLIKVMPLDLELKVLKLEFIINLKVSWRPLVANAYPPQSTFSFNYKIALYK